jgi:hypothetical protein
MYPKTPRVLKTHKNWLFFLALLVIPAGKLQELSVSIPPSNDWVLKDSKL